MSDARNAQGSLCPPWCVTDHDRYHFHGSAEITVEAPRYHRVIVKAFTHSTSGGTSVRVTGGGMVVVPACEAEDFAALVEELATATPEQHRELAAAIRSAAAVAAGDASQEQGAEDCSDDH